MTAPTTRKELIEVMARAASIEEDGDLPDADYRRIMGAVLTALEATGLAVVPVQATEEMEVDGTWQYPSGGIHSLLGEEGNPGDPKPVYTAMLNASPYRKDD